MLAGDIAGLRAVRIWCNCAAIRPCWMLTSGLILEKRRVGTANGVKNQDFKHFHDFFGEKCTPHGDRLYISAMTKMGTERGSTFAIT